MSTTDTLRINGWLVPVSEIQLDRQEIGAYERTQDGHYLKATRNVKRILNATTTPLLRRDAEMLCGIIEGQGDYIDFNGISTRKGSSFGISDTGLSTIPIPSYGEFPPITYIHSQSMTPYFSTYVAGLKNSPNLFSSLNVITGTDTLVSTSGFTEENNGTLFSDGFTSVYGQRSLGLICPTDGNGLRAGGYAKFTPSSSGKHTCSVYVFSENATQIRIAITRHSTGEEYASGVKDIGEAIWTRVFISAVLDSGVEYRFAFSEITDNTGAEYYLDGFKAEKYDIPTAVDFSGGTSDMYLRGELAKFADISSSFSCIMKLSCSDPTGLLSLTATGDQNIASIYGSQTYENRSRTDNVKLFYDPSDDKIKLRIESDVTGVTINLETFSRPPNASAWFGFGLRNYAQHDEHAIKLWGGGPQIQASSNTLVDFRFNRQDPSRGTYFLAPPELRIGGDSNTSAPFYIGTFFIFPYDISTSYFYDFVTAMQLSSRPIIPFPDFYVESSLLPRAHICNGMIKDITTVKGWMGGTFYNNLQKISFELCESYGRFGAVA